MKPALTLRSARPDDCHALAELSTELGYPASHSQLAARLAVLQSMPDSQLVMVAELDDEVCGWIHAYVRPLLESDTAVEIGGLVVATEQRGFGIGASLLTACEQWAKSKNIHTVTLRSNTHRHDAHRFYQRHGYIHTKTSLTLRKALG